MHACMLWLLCTFCLQATVWIQRLFLALTTSGVSFLLMLRLSSIAYTCLDDMVSEGGASAWLKVFTLTWRRYPLDIISLCDITEGRFPKLCVLAKILRGGANERKSRWDFSLFCTVNFGVYNLTICDLSLINQRVHRIVKAENVN